MAEREVIATYKRYNETGGKVWDTIYFRTAAAAVGESNSRWFMKPVNTVNGNSFTQNGGITLYANDITIRKNQTPETYNYILEGQKITEALKALDKAAKDAKDSVPSGVLTTANYAAVLNSVYQAKNDELDKLTNIAGTGYVMRTTLGYSVATASMLADSIKATNAFVPKERTVNGKALSSNITLTGDDIKTTASGNNISQDIAAIREMANGRSRSFVIDTPAQSETSCNSSFRVPKTNSSTSVVKVAVTGAKPLEDIQNNLVDLSTLVVGDVIFTKTAGMKDWWYAGEAVDTTIQGANVKFYWFYQLDADSITVENTFNSSSQNAISGMGVQAAINTLDVPSKGGDKKYIQSISEENGKISAVEALMPTKLPASNTVSTYSSTGTDPVNGTAVDKAISQTVASSGTSKGVKVAIGGTIKKPTITVTATGGECENGDTNFVDGGTVRMAIDEHVAARATKVFYNLKSQGTPTSGMVAGDICIIEESVVS